MQAATPARSMSEASLSSGRGSAFIAHWPMMESVPPLMEKTRHASAVADRELTVAAGSPLLAVRTPFPGVPAGVRFQNNGAVPDSTGQRLSAPAHSYWHSSTAITLIAFVYMDALPAGVGMISARGDNAASFTQRAWAFQIGNDGKVGLSIYSSGGVSRFGNGTSVLEAGRWYMIAAAWVSGTASFWLNGVPDGTASPGAAAMNTSNATLQARHVDIGILQNGASWIYGFPGVIAGLTHVNSVLSDQQVHEIWARANAPLDARRSLTAV